MAGGIVTTGSNNIYIGQSVCAETADESNTIRIGYSGTSLCPQITGENFASRTFIAGIADAPVLGSPVYVDADGQLGVFSSSRRYKEDIENMGDASSALMKLRPVTFRFKPEYAKGPHTLQYGLIAEEVAEVYPDLVQYDPKTGQPQTVYYHLVNVMLLNEVQKQQRRIREQDKELSALRERLSNVEAMLNR